MLSLFRKPLAKSLAEKRNTQFPLRKVEIGFWSSGTGRGLLKKRAGAVAVVNEMPGEFPGLLRGPKAMTPPQHSTHTDKWHPKYRDKQKPTHLSCRCRQSTVLGQQPGTSLPRRQAPCWPWRLLLASRVKGKRSYPHRGVITRTRQLTAFLATSITGLDLLQEAFCSHSRASVAPRRASSYNVVKDAGTADLTTQLNSQADTRSALDLPKK